MPAIPTYRLDFTEWDKAATPYLRITKRTLPDVTNKKAYYVTRRALYETPATPAATITSALGQIRKSKKKIVSSRLTMGREGNAPLAALIINSQLAKQGKKGLYGPAMATAIALFIGARKKARAFLKSGWIPAVKRLENTFTGSHGGLPPIGAVKAFGVHGRAIPAVEGMKCQALIENSADLDTFRAKFHVPTHHPDALITHGMPAFQRALNLEAQSMMQEVAKRQVEEAKKLGIRAVETIG